MPQAKKDVSTRARKNVAATAANLPERGNDSPVITPDLPERSDGEGGVVAWHKLTREWWADMWASPMSAEYHSSDRHALYILASLIDAFWVTPTKDLAGEIRLQRQAFGLTPYDRRRLEWTIVTAEDAKDGRKARQIKPSPQPKSGDDPRLSLDS